MLKPKLLTISFLAFIGFLTLLACSTEPREIEYNQDQCDECKMMISDPRFGAELVTSKGKVYKYDAAECMIRAVKKNKDTDYVHILVTDFTQPKRLIDAQSASFLIDENRPSPMGANLSAYSTKSDIDQQVISDASQILTWEQTINHF
jgi:copper chaperone NosL